MIYIIHNIYINILYQLVLGGGVEYGRKDSSKHLLTAVACFTYMLLFFNLV